MSLQGEGEFKPDVGKTRSDGGNKRNNNKKKGRFQGQRGRYVAPKFKGETEALSGHIYDVGTNN